MPDCFPRKQANTYLKKRKKSQLFDNTGWRLSNNSKPNLTFLTSSPTWTFYQPWGKHGNLCEPLKITVKIWHPILKRQTSTFRRHIKMKSTPFRILVIKCRVAKLGFGLTVTDTFEVAFCEAGTALEDQPRPGRRSEGHPLENLADWKAKVETKQEED